MIVKEKKLLIYSCSGCSSVAQLANALALKLDREGHGEMSCIAGVGGGVPSLVKQAQSAEKIIILDGCPLSCCRQCLAKENLQAHLSINLNKFGIKKKQGENFSSEDFDLAYREVISMIKK